MLTPHLYPPCRSQDKDSISYPFTTIGPDGGPKARFVLHRGFVNERRKDGDGSSNPSDGNDNADVSSEILLSTTDIRAPKSQQLSQNDKIEIAWWFAPSGDQYRITGRAFIYGHPSNPISKSFIDNHAKRLSPPKLVGKFNWEDERKRIFEKCSPGIKASFYRPAPGTPLKGNGKNGKDIDMNEFPTELKDEDMNKEGVRERCMENFALT